MLCCDSNACVKDALPLPEIIDFDVSAVLTCVVTGVDPSVAWHFVACGSGGSCCCSFGVVLGGVLSTTVD